MTLFALSGCSDDSSDSAKPAGCTEQSAREPKQNFITNGAFDVACAKVVANTQFFFINNDDEAHTVTTQQGAPESFDAELPKKSSTYAHTFAKTGKYEIKCKRHNEAMTLFVI